MENINSEQELNKLREEGAIDEAEYGDLLEAMRKSPSRGVDNTVLENDTPNTKRKLGKIAFYLMLAGIVLPIVCFVVSLTILGAGEGALKLSVFYGFHILLEISALVCGVISWRDPFGKAATIVSGIAIVLGLVWIA